MALYYDAATILSTTSKSGSLKSRIYSNSLDLKSKPASIYALISESAKYDILFKEVIDNAGLLAHETKGAIAASSSHPLRQAIERHKARLQAEFTKSRLRRKCATIEALKKALHSEKSTQAGISRPQPRWIRVNRLRTTLEDQLRSTFKEYRVTKDFQEVFEAGAQDKILYIDLHIPNLVALPHGAGIAQWEAYAKGQLILQDKASCFPAYMLIDTSNASSLLIRNVMDGCAAPGNKTTHIAAILASEADDRWKPSKPTVFACERDKARSKTLLNMITKAGAGMVSVLAEQDFLALNPQDPKFADVTHLLLDPSCSGSGIVGREDIPELVLPNESRKHPPDIVKEKSSKKRKREQVDFNGAVRISLPDQLVENEEESKEPAIDKARLAKLANLQSRIVEHALAFPRAVRVSYSTCSIHGEENEAVVARVLQSRIARDRGWKLLHREEQVEGMKQWQQRGSETLPEPLSHNRVSSWSREAAEACIRCRPGDNEGTMGFFVCCFTRHAAEEGGISQHSSEEIIEDSAWEGFSDGE